MSTKTTTVYKLTTPNRESVGGWIDPMGEISKEYRWLSQKYHTIKWNYPKLEDSYIFVFENIEHALSFGQSCFSCIIWECKGEVVHNLPIKGVNTNGDEEIIKSFWKQIKESKEVDDCWHKPAGTLFCSRIRLVKKLGTIEELS